MWNVYFRDLVASRELDARSLATNLEKTGCKRTVALCHYWISGQRKPGWAAMLALVELLQPEDEARFYRLRAEASIA